MHWKYGKRWGLLAGVVSLLVSMAVGAYVVVRDDISVTQMMGGTDAFYIKPVSSASSAPVHTPTPPSVHVTLVSLGTQTSEGAFLSPPRATHRGGRSMRGSYAERSLSVRLIGVPRPPSPGVARARLNDHSPSCLLDAIPLLTHTADPLPTLCPPLAPLSIATGAHRLP